jgi:hypothetical protein
VSPIVSTDYAVDVVDAPVVVVVVAAADDDDDIVDAVGDFEDDMIEVLDGAPHSQH